MGLRLLRPNYALIVGLGLTLPVPVVAQQSSVPIVESVVLTADLTAGDGSAAVRIEYRLSGGAPDTAVPIQLLGFDEATTDQVRVGDRDPVVLWPTSGSLRASELQRE